MLTWIVTHSVVLCNFLIPLLANFSPEPQRHALNVVEALLLCPLKHKTLSALTRCLLCPHADHLPSPTSSAKAPGRGMHPQARLALYLFHPLQPGCL